MTSKNIQAGMTLIETMLSMLISVVLLGGVIEIFINSKQTYNMQQNVSRLQENGRFALDFIGYDVRMASYWGCLTKVAGDISGVDNTTVGADTGTDTLTLKSDFTELVDQTAAVCGTVVNNALNYYTSAASSIHYSINSGVLQRNNVDLVEGIENMQILYGEDVTSDGIADYYVNATQVANMENVKSLRIYLLVKSLENVSVVNLPYTYNGTDYTGDQRLHRVFSSTIAIRNRIH